MKIVKVIKNAKRSRLYCKWVEHKDKRMIKLAVKSDLKSIKMLMRFKNRIKIFVGYGILSVEEGAELYRHITNAIDVLVGRRPEELAERISDLSVRRIADKVGGEVVEGEVT